MVEKMVMKIGETVWLQGMFYNKSIQFVLLYGSKSWVVMGAMLKVLEVFHHREAIMPAHIMTSGE